MGGLRARVRNGGGVAALGEHHLVPGLVVQLEARGQGDDERVPVAPVPRADLHPDRVDPLGAVAVQGGHAEATHVGAKLDVEVAAPGALAV